MRILLVIGIAFLIVLAIMYLITYLYYKRLSKKNTRVQIEQLLNEKDWLIHQKSKLHNQKLNENIDRDIRRVNKQIEQLQEKIK